MGWTLGWRRFTTCALSWNRVGLEWYKDNLPCSLPGQLVVERSSNYIRIEKGDTFPNASFKDAIFPDKKKVWRKSYLVRNSNFSFFFSAWLRVFPLEQFHIVDGDNLKINPWEEVMATERFLGVKPYVKPTLSKMLQKDSSAFVIERQKSYTAYLHPKAEGIPKSVNKLKLACESTTNRIMKYFISSVDESLIGNLFGWSGRISNHNQYSHS